MTPEGESRLRLRGDATRNRLGRLEGPGPLSEGPAFVGRVYGNPTVPAGTGCYVSVHPVAVGGAEAEAAPGVLTPDTTRGLVVYLVGSKAAAAGDDLVCRFVGHRWVAERLNGRPSNVFIPGCPCVSSPATLTMTSSDPTSNNFMFQNATFAYGPVPPGLARLQIGAGAYLSTRAFTDAATNDQFWYYLTCYFNYYILTRVYATSVYGSPYRDQVRYRWLLGFPGNTCTPFLLSRGAVFAGGDPTCVVTISE